MREVGDIKKAMINVPNVSIPSCLSLEHNLIGCTSICCTVRSRNVASFRTEMRLLGDRKSVV